MNADLHCATSSWNRLIRDLGRAPSTGILVAAIEADLAVLPARPGEPHRPAPELAAEIVAGLPLDERAAVALADHEHPGKLGELARQIEHHLVWVSGPERERLAVAHNQLLAAVAAAKK